MNNIIVYLSGKYSGDTETNIAIARELAEQVWGAGYPCLCPHTNTANFKGNYDRFLDGYLKFLQKCDCLLMLPNWEMSKGACIEHDFAKNLGMNVFYSLKELQTYYELKEIEELWVKLIRLTKLVFMK